MANLTKTQIDKLGDVLRTGFVLESELRILDDYRQSFFGAYEEVVTALREEFNLEPTGRPSKTTASIIAKLDRETIRLSQLQDIAGCRVVVPDIPSQDRVVALITSRFDGATVIDRRLRPTNGYRAVHIIVTILDKRIEIQVRSSLQHLWAELSEKLADQLGSELKYGDGEEPFQGLLAKSSSLVAQYENVEPTVSDVLRYKDLLSHHTTRVNAQQFVEASVELKRLVLDLLKDAITAVDQAVEAAKKDEGV